MGGALISLGVGLVTSGLNYLLSPTQTVQKNKINDLGSPKSNYGAAIPRIWGKVRVSGNLIWATDKIEKVSVEGGGKGGAKVQTENYSYYGNFAVMFCRGPIERYDKIWLNDKLVFTSSGKTEQSLEDYARFYLGSRTQNSDPLLSLVAPTASDGLGITQSNRAAVLSSLGIDFNAYQYLTPAYRNRAYIAFEQLPLQDYFNDFPVVSAEIVQSENITLAEVMHDILIDGVGYSPEEIDVTALANIPVEGFYLNSTIAATEAIAQLESVFFVEHYQSNGILKFVPENRQTSIISIERSDLVLIDENASYDSSIDQSEELPSEIRLIFNDKNRSYGENTVYSRRQQLKNVNNSEFSTNVILDESKAQKIVDLSLLKVWSSRTKYDINLQPKYLNLEVGDRLQVENITLFLLQIIEKQIGADLALKLKLKEIDLTGYEFDRNLSSGNIGIVNALLGQEIPLPLCPNSIPANKIESIVKRSNLRLLVPDTDYTLNGNNTVTFLSNHPEDPIQNNTEVAFYLQCPIEPKTVVMQVIEATNWVILDIPVFDGDPRFEKNLYWFAAGNAGNKNWYGASLHVSTDDISFKYIDKIDRSSTFGHVLSNHSYTSGNGININSNTYFDVQLYAGSLESNIYNDRNWFYFNGEILRFQTAQLINTNLYRLTGISKVLPILAANSNNLNNFYYRCSYLNFPAFSTNDKSSYISNNINIDFILLTGNSAYFKRVAYNNFDIASEKQSESNKFLGYPVYTNKSRFIKVESLSSPLDNVYELADINSKQFEIKGHSLILPTIKLISATRFNGNVTLQWDSLDKSLPNFKGYIVRAFDFDAQLTIQTFNSSLTISLQQQQEALYAAYSNPPVQILRNYIIYQEDPYFGLLANKLIRI